MNVDLQRWVYEEIAFLAPVVSALLAGFAIMVCGDIYLTPAGVRYLAEIERERVAA